MPHTCLDKGALEVVPIRHTRRSTKARSRLTAVRFPKPPSTTTDHGPGGLSAVIPQALAPPRGVEGRVRAPNARNSNGRRGAHPLQQTSPRAGGGGSPPGLHPLLCPAHQSKIKAESQRGGGGCTVGRPWLRRRVKCGCNAEIRRMSEGNTAKAKTANHQPALRQPNGQVTGPPWNRLEG